jgi:hypothetical protein
MRLLPEGQGALAPDIVIPPPDVVVRAMLDALLQRSWPTLKSQKNRHASGLVRILT